MTTHESKFYNKKGALNSYSLKCGKVQLYSKALGKAELYHEGGVFHVRLIIKGWENSLWNDREGSGKQWQSFESLTKARAKFVNFCHLVDIGDYPNTDESWPSCRWNADYTDYHDLSGHSKNWPWCAAFSHDEIAC